MSIEHRIGPDGRDDDVTRELRSLYAAPTEDAYWQALQARILAAVSGAAPIAVEAWWAPLSRWSRTGAVAAALALREMREQSALQAAMLNPNTPRAQLSAVAGHEPDNDAVLRDALTP